MIKPVCESDFKVKRHQLGIFPKDRAVMAFQGEIYSVNFDNLRNLMVRGTDIIIVEKQGTVIKLLPFTESNGIAFIQAEGFVTEYGIALGRLSIGGDECLDYTDGYLPEHKGHLGVLTDCDASGITIGLQIKNATRIGIGLDTIDEINNLNPGLGLRIEDLMESALTKKGKPNSHWIGLNNLLLEDGRKKNEINCSWSKEERSFYIPYLWEKYDGVPFIEWLKDYRIELNTVLTVIKAQKFWNWLKFKLEELWPDRYYNRAWFGRDDPLTPVMQDFIRRLHNTTKPIVAPKYKAVQTSLTKVKDFIDIDEKDKQIKSSMQKVLLKHEQIKGIDQALKQFAIDKNLAPVKT